MSFGKNIRGALSYNEQKIRGGSAELILASQFGRDINDMGFSEKHKRFEKLIQLNGKIKTNTLHVSLNFSPDDQLDKEKLQLLAVDYMDRIGFGGQPFLVYQHNDTGHPHLHIVTTTIQSNRKSIYLHNLAKRKSEPARKEMEIQYNLIKAEGRKQTSYLGSSAKISNIVSRVVNEYKYGSFDELNAILRQFNVIAEKGSPGSFLNNKGGLIFCPIDKDGYKIGKSIKASSIYKSPTLSVLCKKFERNNFSKAFYQQRIQSKVLTALARASSADELGQLLKEKDVGCSVQYNPAGEITSLNFVDHASKTVFHCKEFGLSIFGILEKLNEPGKLILREDKSKSLTNQDSATYPSSAVDYPFAIIKTLLSSEHYQPEISPEFFKKKKKKRKH